MRTYGELTYVHGLLGADRVHGAEDLFWLDAFLAVDPAITVCTKAARGVGNMAGIVY